MRRIKRYRATVKSSADRPLARPDDIEIDVVKSKIVAQQFGEVRGDCRIVDQVAIALPPLKQRSEPVRPHIRRAFARDVLVQNAIETGDLLLSQRIGHNKVALQVEQISFLVVHGEPSKPKRRGAMNAPRHALSWSYFDFKPVVIFKNSCCQGCSTP